MPKLDIVHAKIQLDEYTIIPRGETNPMNWAEIELMWFQHGERAVSDIVIVDTVDAANIDVLQDLRIKYGADSIKEAFPGSRPRLPMQAPAEFTRKPKAAKRRSRAKKAEVPEAETLADAVMAAETAAE